jgi:mono/diheme cytochrome c family protein
MEGILDTTLRLVNFTAAGGPTIYRGDLFGDKYIFNAFVAEPAANLIKRNVLNERGYTVTGDQAYQDKEFLRSVDERFRPVSLYNGPDGALYIVDMYRGIIQHKTYLTDYLKNQIKIRNLDQPHTYGRIYRVVPNKGKTEITIMPTDELSLVALLNSSNGWLRDKAQQILIDKKMVSAAPKLLELLENDDKPLTQIHSLWTLEGLGILKPENIIPLMTKTDWHIRAQAITAASSIIDKDNYKAFIPSLEALVENADSLAAPYIAFTVQKMRKFDASAGEKILYALAKTFANNTFIADAIISNLEGEEDLFLKKIEGASNNDNTVIKQRLRQVLLDIKKAKDDVNTKKAERNFPKGAAIFKTSCMSCHGKDGYGIETLAPTLNNSDWVLGNKDKLIATVLFGLTGPIVVNDEIPEVTGDMPGIGQNAEFSDEDIAQTISFIRSAWSNNASKVSASDIKKIRDKFIDRRSAFTMSEIDSIWKKQN